MARTYRIIRSQQLHCDIRTAWAFFSIPVNLERITPPEMKLKVISRHADQPVHESMVLEFRVSPLFGIPLKWGSSITQVDSPRSFTDVQTNGPYRLWRHHHEYFENADGVLVRDTVDYALPFGRLGGLAHGLVRKQLEKLFEYRHQKLEQLFGN